MSLPSPQYWDYELLNEIFESLSGIFRSPLENGEELKRAQTGGVRRNTNDLYASVRSLQACQNSTRSSASARHESGGQREDRFRGACETS